MQIIYGNAAALFSKAKIRSLGLLYSFIVCCFRLQNCHPWCAETITRRRNWNIRNISSEQKVFPNKNKQFRSFKSKENINKKDGQCLGFSYKSLISDPIRSSSFPCVYELRHLKTAFDSAVVKVANSWCQNLLITQTRACNIVQYFTAVKMINFR